MKQIICLIVMALMVASVALAAEKITAKDLAGLKGTWVGWMHFGSEEDIKAHKEIGATFPSTSWSSGCTLEILNDTVPVQAKLTLGDVPAFIASNIGAQGARIDAHGASKELNLNDGQLTSQGTILWMGPEKNFFQVSLTGEKRLSVSYIYRMIEGTALLKKK